VLSEVVRSDVCDATVETACMRSSGGGRAELQPLLELPERFASGVRPELTAEAYWPESSTISRRLAA
jgi:hypothetical protein